MEGFVLLVYLNLYLVLFLLLRLLEQGNGENPELKSIDFLKETCGRLNFLHFLELVTCEIFIQQI